MLLSVAFRHMAHSEDVKEYLEKRLKKVSKLLKEPIEVRATFNHEKFRYDLTLRIKSQWFNFNVTESGTDWRSVIDSASSSIENIARKERERVKERKKKQKLLPQSLELISEKTSSEMERPLIKEKLLKLKPVTIEEALEELKNNNRTFLVYLDDSTNSVRVMHRKSKNVIEIIVPELA